MVPRHTPRRSPEPRESPADAAQARRNRARDEPLDVSWIATDPYVIALVRNPLHGTRYRVYAPDMAHLDAALCTCPDFAHRGAETCKHVEAIRLGHGASPEPVPPVARGQGSGWRWWEAVARERAGWGRHVPTLTELRREGRLLIDGPAGPPAG